MGSVALATRARALAREQEGGGVAEVTEWDKVLVSYLSLLSVWCWGWEEGVKEVLEEGGALSVVSETASLATSVPPKASLLHLI